MEIDISEILKEEVKKESSMNMLDFIKEINKLLNSPAVKLALENRFKMAQQQQVNYARPPPASPQENINQNTYNAENIFNSILNALKQLSQIKPDMTVKELISEMENNKELMIAEIESYLKGGRK